MKTKENNKWICTDPDNQQYGREINKNVFEFKERGEQLTIDLIKYTDEQIIDNILGYYKSLEELKDIYGTQSNWIIAECIFEQESGLY